MKIKILNSEYITHEDVIISEAYNGLTIKTNEGKKLNICLRDYGFDMNIDGGKWFHIENEEDICCITCERKKKLRNIIK